MILVDFFSKSLKGQTTAAAMPVCGRKRIEENISQNCPKITQSCFLLNSVCKFAVDQKKKLKY
jgi:hypothetical protein